jgi:hypothetical protein
MRQISDDVAQDQGWSSSEIMLRRRMLRLKTKRLASKGKLAAQTLHEIETSIKELGDEDVLDIADIFRDRRDTPLAAYAFAEVDRRKLRL